MKGSGIATYKEVPPLRHRPYRACAEPGCITMLSTYNPGPNCRAHTPMVPVLGHRGTYRRPRGT